MVHYSKIVLLNLQLDTFSTIDMTILQSTIREYCSHADVHTQKCVQNSNAI